MNRRRLSILALLGGLFIVPATASAAPKVITTTSDLASLAAEVGGDKVTVESLAKGYQDPHFVEAKPSFVIKLHGADLLIAVGRELEIGWLPPLVTQARNPNIQPGGAGYLDASQTVRILDIPTGQLTRAMGDVHPSGNPHYWLDPGNGKLIAKAIEGKLSAMDGANAASYRQREQDFERRLDAADARWKAALAPYKGVKLVTYHRSWPNFVDHFGFEVIGYVEPKPGIPPSPSHTIDLIQEMKRQNVKIILVEPYFDLKTPNSIAQNTGGQVVVLAPSVGAEKEITDYIKLFDYDVNVLVAAFKAAGVK
jgi:zinc/manganese transport system substrate-binding protein